MYLSAIQCKLFDDIPGEKIKDVKFKPIEYPVWTERKAKLIQHYLYLFVQITKHGTYIDGFAGPQNEKDQESWAAKLAIDCEPKWMRNFYLFDKNKKQYECLIQLKNSQPDEPSREINVECGDFNKLVHKFFKKWPIGKKEATFCLLDQRTFECHWSTVEAIAKHKKSGYKIEIFYFLPISWLDRAFSGLKKNKKKILKAWWGRDDWEKIINDRNSNRVLLFCKRFQKDLEYNYVDPWPIYEKRGGGRIMYYMIHATDHPAAPKLMRRSYEAAIKHLSTERQLTFDFNKKRSTAK